MEVETFTMLAGFEGIAIFSPEEPIAKAVKIEMSSDSVRRYHLATSEEFTGVEYELLEQIPIWLMSGVVGNATYAAMKATPAYLKRLLGRREEVLPNAATALSVAQDFTLRALQLSPRELTVRQVSEVEGGWKVELEDVDGLIDCVINCKGIAHFARRSVTQGERDVV